MPSAEEIRAQAAAVGVSEEFAKGAAAGRLATIHTIQREMLRVLWNMSQEEQ